MTQRRNTEGPSSRRANAQTTRKKSAARKPAKSRAALNKARSQARSRNTKRPQARNVAVAKANRKRKRILIAVAVVACLAIAAFAASNIATCQVANTKFSAVEKWRSTVQQACEDTKLGAEWTDSLLAAMYVESGGNEDVNSVEGVEHDIMQAAEGAYGGIVKKGSKKYGVDAQTCEASIYAGALEFKQNLKLWHGYFDDIQPDNTDEVQLVIQGYNFGAQGWYRWCVDNGVEKYTTALAQKYSDERMPEDAKGTPTHAAKWLDAYKRILADKG